MALTQQKFREIVFQALFSLEFVPEEEMELIALLMKNSQISRKNALAALEKARQVSERQILLDAMIGRVSKDFPLERIPCAERNVLRLALFEMLDGKIPHKVAISEGIRLGRKYATSEAAHFVNAILDALYKEMDEAGEK